MADMEGNIDARNYGIGVAAKQDVFNMKGSANAEWGVKYRLSRIFDRESGNTVMLAFDHGYIMGPTSGLERIDLTINPLLEYADCVMCTRGALRSTIPPMACKPLALRFSAGTTVLTSLNDECLLSIEEAIRLDACAIAPMVAVGGEFEAVTIKNLAACADFTARYSIPTLGVTAVGRELVRDARYLGLAARVCAENGANFVKTYYCDEGFEKVVAACPVPIVIAGGKKLPESEALELAYKAVQSGARGVDMGRNIFQAENPAAMIQAVRAVVHKFAKPSEAFELYKDLCAD